jgi:hypothetical protein
VYRDDSSWCICRRRFGRFWRRGSARHQLVAASQWRGGPDWHGLGHFGAVGCNSCDRVHDFAVRGRKRSAGARRPGDEALVYWHRYGCRVPCAGSRGGDAAWRATVSALLLAARWGSSRNLARGQFLAPSSRLVILRAVLAAQLTMLVAGAAVLVTSLWIHLKRVEALHEALEPGVLAAVVLLVLQLAFAPNALVWSASYALGSGFSIGAGSVVAPGSTQLGIVPAVPLLGALPAAGPGDMGQLWWLAAGAIAGAIACWVAVSNRPAVRLDQASLRGGVCGLLAGAVFAAVAWATSGDLGALRFTDLGPRLFPLLVMASTTMGLSGMITGLALRLMPRRRK